MKPKAKRRLQFIFYPSLTQAIYILQYIRDTDKFIKVKLGYNWKMVSSVSKALMNKNTGIGEVFNFARTLTTHH